MTLDGTYLGTWHAGVGEAIEIDVAVNETPHLLAVTRLAGDNLAPGTVRVR